MKSHSNMAEFKDSPDVSEKVQDHRNLRDWTITNSSDPEHHLPINMVFNDGHKLSITVYSFLMVFSAVANLTVLSWLIKRRRQTPTRINTMLMHLAIADLLVTFLMMPLEIAWSATVQWIAGDAMCRIMMFFRIFGLYLSSFILICISIDRYYAVLKPLQLAVIDRREKLMLISAWVGAVFCSAPQMFIFHVERHPEVKWYKQCVTYHSLPTPAYEVAYSVSGMIMLYAFPLCVIIYSYASILVEIFRRTRNPSGADSITRSSLAFLGKAKIRTLKMTIIIVFVFFVCWTPYHVMCVWYWYDRESALKVDQRIQKGLFLFACTNSCMNPIVYGVFNVRARRRGVRVRPRVDSNPLPRTKLPAPRMTAETRLSPLELSLRSLE
ncbi:adipokinetic hormone/corazonin-related peptide receptor variant I [Cylas formicarius]|uniref:adipokinetic hormone/corazonin-related peptide receptor variant I n=1 Tax=Cylas formicarius TaxID=197179 RepID=UPI00295854CC|nr:adipokinetic hormone/corazonin-related peptide receptor variant I [Cylas formicarius]XP_060537051.1 adipokinetic hormone/corazonin-related peptide receptor variant I [Cylas formicarius]